MLLRCHVKPHVGLHECGLRHADISFSGIHLMPDIIDACWRDMRAHDMPRLPARDRACQRRLRSATIGLAAAHKSSEAAFIEVNIL